ncbi:MAG TPA: GAF domain-containing protein, partial [Thermodesulfobacteriota bacterium]|nr:GAF domain-containing protein [Thermodesulfobacteriota bacterium]
MKEKISKSRKGIGKRKGLTHRHTQRRGIETALMAEIGRIISSTLNIEEVYERFAQKVHQLIPFDRIAISIINQKEGTATNEYVLGTYVPGRQPKEPFALAGSINEDILRTRKSLLVQRDDQKELGKNLPSLLTTFQAGLRSMMSIPLFSQDQIIGVLHFRSKKAGAYTKNALKLAESIGTQIAGAIANAQFFREREHAQETLREREERYRSLLETMEEGYFEVDLNGNFTFANDSLIRMSGLSKDELLGM